MTANFGKMDEIKPGLFLGSVEAILDVNLLEEKQIGAILTVSDVSLEESVKQSGDDALKSWFSADKAPKPCSTLFIEADDTNAQELISHFDETYQFIAENLKPGQRNGSVLVHCWAGRSRSATIMAAYLMKSEKIGVAAALETISRARPILCPMRGFVEQLHLYARFGCRFDDVNGECKKFYISKLEEWLEHNPDNDDASSDKKQISQVVTAFVMSDEEAAKNPEAKSYRCCRCGHFLFTSDDLTVHDRGAGAITFVAPEPGEARRKGHKGHHGGPVATSCRESLFVEPLPWMQDVILTYDGKLHCPNQKCNYKIGSFTWLGERCKCGRWVTPAFHMAADRVEQRGKIALLPKREPLVGLAMAKSLSTS